MYINHGDSDNFREHSKPSDDITHSFNAYLPTLHNGGLPRGSYLLAIM